MIIQEAEGFSLKSPAKVRLRDEGEGSWSRNITKYWPLYVFAIPGVVFLIIFKYIPIIGTIIAFKEYSVFKGIMHSPWVGFKQFHLLFNYDDFWQIFLNSLFLGFSKTVLCFPISLILALMINEIGNNKLKRLIQTSVYIPHFFSWVIVGGLVFDLLSTHGLVNQIRAIFGEQPVLFMQEASKYRMIYILSGIWKESGWGTIVYLAVISGIDPQIYESVMIDGANKLKTMLYITIPLLIPTILTLFLLGIGNFLELGFDQSYNLLTTMTYRVGDIFDTFVFRNGIQQGKYNFSTAVGIFQSVIGFTLVFTFNKLSKKFSDGGLW